MSRFGLGFLLFKRNFATSIQGPGTGSRSFHSSINGWRKLSDKDEKVTFGNDRMVRGMGRRSGNKNVNGLNIDKNFNEEHELDDHIDDEIKSNQNGKLNSNNSRFRLLSNSRNISVSKLSSIRNLVLDILRSVPSPREAKHFLQRSMVAKDVQLRSSKRKELSSSTKNQIINEKDVAYLDNENESTNVNIPTTIQNDKDKIGVVFIFISPQSLSDNQITSNIGGLCSRLSRLMYFPIIIMDYRYESSNRIHNNRVEIEDKTQNVVKMYYNVENSTPSNDLNHEIKLDNVINNNEKSKQNLEPKNTIKKNSFKPKAGYSSTLAELLNDNLINSEEEIIEEKPQKILNNNENVKIDDKNNSIKTDNSKIFKKDEKREIDAEIQYEYELNGADKHHFAKFREDVSFHVERLIYSLSEMNIRSVPLDGFLVSDISTPSIDFCTKNQSIHQNFINGSNIRLDFERIFKYIDLGLVPILTPIGISNKNSQYIYVDPRVNLLKISEGLSYLFNKKKILLDSKENQYSVDEDPDKELVSLMPFSGNVKVALIHNYGGFIVPNSTTRQSVKSNTFFTNKSLVNLKAESHLIEKDLNNVISNINLKYSNSRGGFLFGEKLLNEDVGEYTSAFYNNRKRRDPSQSNKEIINRLKWQIDVTKTLESCLKYLPSTSTAILTNPELSTKQIIQHIITDKPPTASAHIKHSISKINLNNDNGIIINGNTITCMKSTIIRYGLNVKLIKGNDKWVDTLRIIKENNLEEQFNIKDTNVSDIDKIEHLIDADMVGLLRLLESSFGRQLRIEEFIKRMIDKIDLVIIVGDNEGCAIITKEEFGPDVNNLNYYSYLDKFAVNPKNQGSGIADIIWQELQNSYNNVYWRSRSANPVNGWYFLRSSIRINLGYWTIFGYGKILPKDINDICNKNIGIISIPASFK